MNEICRNRMDLCSQKCLSEFEKVKNYSNMIKLVFTYEHSQRHKTHSNSYVPGYVLQVGYSGTIASASFKFCEIHIYIYIYI